MSSTPDNRTRIIVAILGLLGIIIPSLFMNWENIFGPKQEHETTEVAGEESKNVTAVEKRDSEEVIDGKTIPSDDAMTTDVLDQKETDGDLETEAAYFKILASKAAVPNDLDFDKNTSRIGFSRKPHQLNWIRYEDIGIKIGIVQIDKVNNKVIAKLTNSNEHFDKSDGRIIENWFVGETKQLINGDRILEVRLSQLKKSGRGDAYFNIKSWLK